MHASDLAGINGISQIFTGTHLPARYVSLGPHTAPLTRGIYSLHIKLKNSNGFPVHVIQAYCGIRGAALPVLNLGTKWR